MRLGIARLPIGRLPLSATAFGFALVAGASIAHAQTVFTREIADQPVETVITQQPLVLAPAAAPTETVQTTETIRTIRPALRRTARRQVVTTRTITRRFVPAPTVVARTIPAAPQPLYDEVAPSSLATDASYGPPLYDEVTPAPVVAATPVVQDGAVVATQPYIYRYVYEPDRILVIDPTSGVAVQSIPR